MRTLAKHRSGFTLIEALIYIAIVSMVVTGLVLFSISISNTRTKTYVVQEVQANTRTALDIIERRIRGALGIDLASSTLGSDPGVLILRMSDAQKDPTVINLDADDGFLMITEGSNATLPLTSNKVIVTNLVFTDLTASSSRESIRIEMTIAFDNPGTSVEYNFVQNVQTSVTVRK